MANILIFAQQILFPEDWEGYMLAVGDGLHPVQWLTCNFLHADIAHLLGNMISLWTFGLIVEGKLGAWKTLAVYLGIGILYGAITQILLLFNPPAFALGASAAIFGFMALALLWAPENTINCLTVVAFRPIVFEVKVKILVAIFFGLQILSLYLTGGRLSSEFLHTIGGLVGLVVGIVMLKTGQVDCEHWDIFSVYAGLHLLTDAERQQREMEKPENQRQLAEQREKRKSMLLDGFYRSLEEGNPLVALKIRDILLKDYPDWQLPEGDWLLLIHWLIEKKQWTEMLDTLREFLSRHPRHAPQVRLKLAWILVYELHRPYSARRVLARIDTRLLNDAEREVFRHLCEVLAKQKPRNDDTQTVYDSGIDE